MLLQDLSTNFWKRKTFQRIFYCFSEDNLIFSQFRHVCIIITWFHEHIFKSNKAAISKRYKPQLRPKIFLFLNTAWRHCLMYKKSNLFAYVFDVNGYFSPNKFVRVCPVKLKIDMVYHMNNTFWKTAFRYLSMYP